MWNKHKQGSPDHISSHFKPVEKKKKIDPADVFGGDSPDDDSAFEAFVTKEIKQPKVFEPPKVDPLPNIPFIKDDFHSPPEDDASPPPKKPQKRKFRDSDGHTEQPHCLGLKVKIFSF